MLEGCFVPYSLLVKDEELLGFHVTEHKVVIEDVAEPDEFVFDGLSADSFQVLDVDYVLVHRTEEVGFVKDNLLGMWQELSVPGEVSLLGPSSWDESEGNESWQQAVGGTWNESPAAEETDDGEVGIAPLKSVVGLFTLIEENGVFMSLDSVELGVRIVNSFGFLRISEKSSNEFQNKTVLEKSLGAEVMVS